jgi:hypothetical protein
MNEIHVKRVSEVRNVSIDMRGKLDSGESLTGTPTILEEETTDLSFSNSAVNTAIIRINGRNVGIGQAVQFRVSGGVETTQYSIRVTVSTDSTPAQTLVENLSLNVIED